MAPASCHCVGLGMEAVRSCALLWSICGAASGLQRLLLGARDAARGWGGRGVDVPMCILLMVPPKKGRVCGERGRCKGEGRKIVNKCAAPLRVAQNLTASHAFTVCSCR